MYFLFLFGSLHTAQWRPAIIDFGIFPAKTDQSRFEPEADLGRQPAEVNHVEKPPTDKGVQVAKDWVTEELCRNVQARMAEVLVLSSGDMLASDAAMRRTSQAPAPQ